MGRGEILKRPLTQAIIELLVLVFSYWNLSVFQWNWMFLEAKIFIQLKKHLLHHKKKKKALREKEKQTKSQTQTLPAWN